MIQESEGNNDTFQSFVLGQYLFVIFCHSVGNIRDFIMIWNVMYWNSCRLEFFVTKSSMTENVS